MSTVSGLVTVALVLTIVLGSVAGAVAIQQRRLLRDQSSFAGRLIAAQDREQARIARELHDDLVMRLTTVTHLLREQNGRITESQAEEFDQIAEEIRLVARALHPTAVDYHGLEPALRTLIDAKERHSGVTVDAAFSGPLDALDGPRRLTIYRVAQEALTNAIQHSGARVVHLRLAAEPGSVYLLVRDEGEGFDAGATPHARGLGLASMEERVKLFRGRLQCTSSRGHGTEVRVEIPLPILASA